MSESEVSIKPTEESLTLTKDKKRKKEKTEVIVFTPRKNATITSGRYNLKEKLSKRKSQT